MRISMLAVSLVLTLVGCGTVEKIQDIATETLPRVVLDLKAASDAAHRWDDAVAFTCYDFLIEKLETVQTEPGERPEGAGLIYTFQVARTGRRILTDFGGSTEFKLACEPLKSEYRALGGSLGRIIGIGLPFGI